ncbi:serine hydrolase domain-containing protein [Tunturibacter psychrotolerans]|uniref:Serine hydrolase domain-containing protein n=1 Tax=Tunturiibacter psychrotolerans TaxID=3069686 RepID=A0AAU7ZR40_9BACT
MTIRLVRVAVLFGAFLLMETSLLAQSGSTMFDGVWLGTLNVGAQTLRLQLHLQTGVTGSCTLDSLDQNGFRIVCDHVEVKGEKLSFEVPTVGGSWSGRISADGKTLTGTWMQGGGSWRLVMQHQATAIGPSETAALVFDPAMAAVAVTDLKPVLDHDLVAALKDGMLAPQNHGGVTIGVVQRGVKRIFNYGAASPDDVFEIGSITKTFTGLILAQMVEQGKVRLDEPVRELLPPGTVAKPTSGAEITLLELSDQHSGLPRLPENLKPADPRNPYADYDESLLYAYIAQHGVGVAPGVAFGYSNLGVGLLGQALAVRSGESYAELLHAQITGPLQMRSTGIALSAEMRAHLAQGHDVKGQPVGTWDLTALAGAGAVRSTAADMLTYLEAQLHPDHLPVGGVGVESKTLGAAIKASHFIHAEISPGIKIGLNWFRDDATGNYFHDGATGGYSSYSVFNPEKDFALVVLCNTTQGADAFANRLGGHITQRMAGVPAISLAPLP